MELRSTPGELQSTPGGDCGVPPGEWKRTSGNSLSPLGAQNKDISASSWTLLTEVKLHLLKQAAIHHTSILYLSGGFL